MESNTWAPPNPEDRVAKGAMYQKNGKTVVDFRRDNGKFMSKEEVKNLSAGTQDGELTPDQWVDREMGRDQGPIDPDAAAWVDQQVNGGDSGAELPPPLPGSMQQEGGVDGPGSPVPSNIPGEVGSVKIPVRDGESDGTQGANPEVNNIPYDQENEPLDPNEPVKWKEDIEAEKASKLVDWEDDPDFATKPEGAGGVYDQNRELPPPEPGSMIYEGGPDGPIIPGQTPEVPEVPNVREANENETGQATDDLPEIPDVREATPEEIEATKKEQRNKETYLLNEIKKHVNAHDVIALTHARDKFIRLSAKDTDRTRVGFGSRERAEEAYNRARDKVHRYYIEMLKRNGVDQERIQALSRFGSLLELGTINDRIRNIRMAKRERNPEIVNKFYDFWERQAYTGHLKDGGRVKKFAHSVFVLPFKKENWKKTLNRSKVLIPLGAVLGTGFGAASLAFIGGGNLIAALTTGAATGLARGSIIAKWGHESSGKARVERDHEEILRAGTEAIESADSTVNTEVFSGTVGKEVKKNITGNRKRVGRAALYGAVAGLAAIPLRSAANAAVDRVVDRINGNGGGSATPEVSSGNTGQETSGGGAGQEVSSGNNTVVPEIPEHGDSGYDYPWNWARDQFGGNDASAQLHQLSDKAAAAGYQVEWHNANDGIATNDWLEINGSSDPDDVIAVLNQFK